MPPPPKKEVPAVEVNETCPECGGPMKLRQAARRRLLPGLHQVSQVQGHPRGVAGDAGTGRGDMK